MKKIKFIFIILPAFLLLLCSCNNANSDTFDSDKIKVSIIDSNFFTAENNSAIIERNQNFTTLLKMRDGYIVDYCSYPAYSLEKIEENVYSLTVYDIDKPVRIKLSARREDGFNTYNETFTTQIKYNFNDGTSKYELKEYELGYHIRQNTWTATDLKREGYTLTGWNTESDYTGEHIGLGSRVSVKKDETLELYAEWVKWTNEKEFLYSRNGDDTVSLTGYKGKGKDDVICLPEYINGYKVTKVASSFTTNIPCGKIASKSLIIPNTITYIEDYAFKNSAFENVYFSDNLDFSSYKSFDYNIAHYFINAYDSPRLQKNNYNVRFADNIDMLIEYQSEKKLVLYGGCNFTYGIYSPMLENAFSDYKVINCGLNGEFNSLFQMEIIEKYLGEGDIFIHAPEQMNRFQFMGRFLVDSRMFAMIEGNYDLLSIADFSYSSYIIEAYTDYKALRLRSDECSYADYPGFFNTYGDYLEDRDYYEPTEISRDVMYTENYVYDIGVLDTDSISLLGKKYNDIASKGTMVFFTHSPMNENSCEEDVIYEKAAEFQTVLAKALKEYDVTIISEITDYIFKGRYFFDTDYHMNYYGAELRTEKLIEDLKKAGVK